MHLFDIGYNRCVSEQSQQMHKFEQVAQRVAPGSRLCRVWNLKGGISAEMVALEVETAVGSIEKMIIRRFSDDHLRNNPQIAAVEYQLLQITQDQGLAAPAPYYCDQTGHILSKPYLLLEYIEGEMDFSPADLASMMRQLAVQLAQIHQIDPTVVDLSFLHDKEEACPELQSKRPSASGTSLLERRIEERLLAAGPLAEANAPALLHGDFWPGNSLWRDDELVAVIDWEDAALGDPLIDLAQSRAEIVWIYGVEAMKIFTHTYQSLMDLDYRNLAYWDLCAAHRVLRIAGGDLAGLASYFAPYGRADISAESIEENLSVLLR